MSFFDASLANVGEVLVTTTQDKGHDPEFWAKVVSDRIVSIGGNCHPVIAQQAEAFKQSVVTPVSFYIKEAIKSDRTTLIAELERQGHGDMANIIRRL